MHMLVLCKTLATYVILIYNLNVCFFKIISSSSKFVPQWQVLSFHILSCSLDTTVLLGCWQDY